MTYDLSGKTALVSGGAHGIGRAIVERLIAEGARTVIGDVDSTAGEALASDLGDNASFTFLDVTSEQAWTEAVSHAVSFGGKLDILVNNAGIAGETIVSWETSLEEWHRAKDAGVADPKDPDPPVGAQMFWDPGHYAGHIATYVGDGRAVTNMPDGSVKAIKWRSMNDWGPYLGWASPYYK